MDSMDWGDGIASRRTFGGCHSIHLSYGRDVLICAGILPDSLVVEIWGDCESLGPCSKAGHRCQMTLNVLKVSPMRLAQGFFGCCVQQNDFVTLAAAPQPDFQFQSGFRRQLPLVV
jgi:hypothetical protein